MHITPYKYIEDLTEASKRLLSSIPADQSVDICLLELLLRQCSERRNQRDRTGRIYQRSPLGPTEWDKLNDLEEQFHAVAKKHPSISTSYQRAPRFFVWLSRHKLIPLAILLFPLSLLILLLTILRDKSTKPPTPLVMDTAEPQAHTTPLVMDTAEPKVPPTPLVMDTAEPQAHTTTSIATLWAERQRLLEQLRTHPQHDALDEVRSCTDEYQKYVTDHLHKSFFSDRMMEAWLREDIATLQSLSTLPPTESPSSTPDDREIIEQGHVERMRKIYESNPSQSGNKR